MIKIVADAQGMTDIVNLGIVMKLGPLEYSAVGFSIRYQDDKPDEFEIIMEDLDEDVNPIREPV